MSRLATMLRRVRRARAIATSAAEPRTTVGEITPFNARWTENGARRLNLLLPSLNRAHYFGGIHTAVLLYRELASQFDASRIVLVDSPPDAEACSRFSDHVLVDAGTDAGDPQQIVAFNDRYGRTLPVSSGDYWLATAWWTAYSAQRVGQWQQEHGVPDRPMAYLIQDYEPGFYPWSSQYALAMSTYRPESDIGIFNTHLLADFFEAQGYCYERRCVFDPELNEGLRDRLRVARESSNQPRMRQIVVYARPGTPRNAFELICEGLRLWGWKDPRARDWSIIAPGELSGDVDLGSVKLRAVGKLDITEYAELLASSAIGVSLMVSPHPSYPPLEMAAFGMSVLTNRYANKDLSASTDNAHVIAQMTPEAICAGLTGLVDDFEARGRLAGTILGGDAPLLRQGGLAEAAGEVVSLWGLGPGNRNPGLEGPAAPAAGGQDTVSSGGVK